MWEPGRGNSKCKGPGARTSLACLRNSKASATAMVGSAPSLEIGIIGLQEDQAQEECGSAYLSCVCCHRILVL